MKRTLNRHFLIVPSLALAVALVGCSDKSTPSASRTTATSPAAKTPPVKTPTSDADETTGAALENPKADAKGGWIGGEPEWSGSGAPAGEGSEGGEPVGDPVGDPAVDYSDGPTALPALAAETTAAMAADTYAAAAETEAMSAEDGASVSASGAVDVRAKRSAAESSRTDLIPYPDEPPAVNQAPLKAGSVDDNITFTDYLDYRNRIESQGVGVRQMDVKDRSVIRVRKANGLPASQRALTIRSGNQTIARLLTTADGTVRFHPSAYNPTRYNARGPFTVDVDGTTEQFTAGNNVDIVIPDSSSVRENMPVEVLFLLDTTGSMGDEIDQLKATIDSVVQRLNDLPGTGEVRLGMTLYRDQNDAFVTANYDFTNNIGSFRKALAQVTADGGGDEPEALDEAFADALAKPNWSAPGKAIQLVFLVADAPPHVDRQLQMPYTTSMIEAASRGIKVFPIASSSTGDQGEYVFRQIAQFTGARFVFLSYGAQGSGGTATGASSDIKQRDYQELSLDELVVRLVGEEAQARLAKVRSGMKDPGTQAPKPIGQ